MPVVSPSRARSWCSSFFPPWAVALTVAGCGSPAVTGSSPPDAPVRVSPRDGGAGDAAAAASAPYGFVVPDAGPAAPTLAAADGGCAPNLTGLVRDFTPAHPDFQSYNGSTASKGIVAPLLGPDRKPVYAHEGPFVDPVNRQQVASPQSFAQWYRNVPGVNQTFEYTVEPKVGPTGVSTFESRMFFPIDGRGFGNFLAGDRIDTGHNFHFTFELHSEFVYGGGEEFTFRGDDDLWVFINGRLAIDLGGLHGELTESVRLDEIAGAFGLTKGNRYPLELFHAERATGDSHFRFDTTIRFANCDKILIP